MQGKLQQVTGRAGQCQVGGDPDVLWLEAVAWKSRIEQCLECLLDMSGQRRGLIEEILAVDERAAQFIQQRQLRALLGRRGHAQPVGIIQMTGKGSGKVNGAAQIGIDHRAFHLLKVSLQRALVLDTHA